jgi:ATP-dependent DNA helicase RecG
MAMKETFVKSKTGKREDPRFYMKLAIEVMKNSVQERAKKDPSPRVGAVLVFPNGDYDTACRGEYREGDHAEYTVMDKKHRGGDLTGCWIFATLEPCGPGARGGCKVPCSLRIADARIEKVWFGVQELNPKAGGGNEYLDKMKVEILPFDVDLHNEIHKFNKDFEDWVEEESKKQAIADSTDSGLLNQAVKNTDISLLSPDALKLYISKTKKSYSWDSEELKADLINKNLLEIIQKTKEVTPTGNCILLFGKNPRDKFQQAAVKVKVDYGDGREPGAKSFDDALVLIPEQVEDWVRKVLPPSMDRSSFTNNEVVNFPPEVIREAVVNAIVHRDYEKYDGAKIQINITPDKIEVLSPGEPFAPNTLEDMQTFSAISYSRNKGIAYIFNLMRLMEETGVGMDTYRSMREKHNLPLPIISYKNPNIIVTFPRNIEGVKETNDKLKDLTSDLLDAYEFVKSNKEVSRKEYEEYAGISEKVAHTRLSTLWNKTIIGDNGEPKKSKKFKYVFVGN